jgi:putative FmdB family regulatory protein
MPIYEYVCEKCNNHLETIQKMTDKPLTTCPECKGSLKKMISNTSFVLKGTGWYVTDYASNKGSSPKTTVGGKQKNSATPSTETTTTAKEPVAAGK